MPSSSAAQHRWIGAMHSHPAEARAAGLSAAAVDEWLHADRGKPWDRARGGGFGYDAGGGVDPTTGGIGGVTPSAQSMNPLVRGMVQRYASLPTEKLQELASAMGGSQQGQLIHAVLQQRLAMPNATQQQPAQQAPQQEQVPAYQPPGQMMQGQARGGATRRADGGGAGIPLSAADPWWTRQESSGMASGFLRGDTAGRADAIKTQAPAGAYVLPADVIAGLGEGNSLAGARIMQEAIASGPWGTPQQRGGQRSEWMRQPVPRAPQEDAKGGPVVGGARPVPVHLSHGEMVVLPEDVTRIGGGDLERGHRILDEFVVARRKKDIKALQKLPGPVKT